MAERMLEYAALLRRDPRRSGWMSAGASEETAAGFGEHDGGTDDA